MRVCKNCGTEFPEEATFCVGCGMAAEECAEPAEETPAEKSLGVFEKFNVSALIGMAAGLVVIVIGIIMLCTASDDLSHASFGADFYTYTYRGIRAVAEQTGKLIRTVSVLVMAFGSFMECYFLGKLKK